MPNRYNTDYEVGQDNLMQSGTQINKKAPLFPRIKP